jgi:DNA repair protein RecO (recombination protein O)
MGQNGFVPTYRDRAVVLRTHKLGEADRIVTLLSAEHGKIRAVAKGVRRTSSKFGARLEPFSYVDLQFATGRTLDTITQAQTLHAFSEPLGADYERFTAGEVMLETADRVVVEERQPARRQHRLLVGALNALVNGTPHGPLPAVMLMDSYLLRAAAMAGYAPVLDSCARCGAVGQWESFSVQAGGLVCEGCRPPGSVRPGPGTVPYLVALLDGDWEAAKGVSAATMNEASGIVAAFVSWYLEQGIRSLDHVDRGVNA